MPDSVPSFVEKSFSSIIPFFAITFIMALVSWGFSFTSYGSVHNLVYSVLQVPIQQIGGSVGGVMVAYALIGLFWWFWDSWQSHYLWCLCTDHSNNDN